MRWGPAHYAGRTACGCEQCGDGPGIDFPARRRTRYGPLRARMYHLLHEDENDLSPAERDELDDLLRMFLHGDV